MIVAAVLAIPAVLLFILAIYVAIRVLNFMDEL